MAHREEECVLGVPAVGTPAGRAVGHVAPGAGRRVPVVGAGLDHERAAPLEPRLEERRPLVPRAHLPEQESPRRVVAVHGGDGEVVPRGPVEVEDDGAIAERLRDRPRDRREQLGEIPFRPHEFRDLEEAAKR